MLTHQPALQIESMATAEPLAVLAHELHNPIGAIRNAAGRAMSKLLSFSFRPTRGATPRRRRR
jgi:nitrogen-specific signal transduction histidine kinase